jgi:hypothetical protein
MLKKTSNVVLAWSNSSLAIRRKLRVRLRWAYEGRVGENVGILSIT